MNVSDSKEPAAVQKELTGWRTAFRSLSNNPVYRHFFVGQVLTRTGNWTQDIAQSWFVLQQTGSGTAVGALLACEFLPILLLSLWAGSLADRHSKRQLLLVTQAAFVALAVALAAVVAFDGPLWLLFVIAAIRGVAGAISITASSAFVAEIVPKKDMRSAASLNGTVFNFGRILGALLAALLMQTVSVSACFLLNAVVYLVYFVIVLRIRPQHINAAPPQSKAGIVDGLQYAWGIPELRAAIVLMFGVGMLAYNSQVFFSLLAEDVYDAGVSMYSLLISVYSAGFILASLIGAAGAAPSNRMLLRAGVALAVMILLEAVFAPYTGLGVVIVVCWGAANGMFGSRINTMVQLHSSPEMKGRVMALWTIVVWGTTPLGAPLVGFIGEHFGARASLAVTGVGIFLCCAYAWSVLRRRLDYVAPH